MKRFSFFFVLTLIFIFFGCKSGGRGTAPDVDSYLGEEEEVVQDI